MPLDYATPPPKRFPWVIIGIAIGVAAVIAIGIFVLFGWM